MNLPKELLELRASVDELVKKYKEIKAMPEMEMPENDKMGKMKRDMEDMMYQMVSYVHQRINRLEDGFYTWAGEHTQNHLPNPSTPSDMQHCLDVLGLSKDFDVKKRTIYASAQCGLEVLK